MAMKYKKVDVPVIVMDNLKKKQKEMERMFKEITGKKKRIPMTKVMIAVSQKPTWIDNDELMKLPKRRVFKI